MERERASEKALAYITSLDMLLDNTNVRRVRQQEQERVRLIGIKVSPQLPTALIDSSNQYFK